MDLYAFDRAFSSAKIVNKLVCDSFISEQLSDTRIWIVDILWTESASVPFPNISNMPLITNIFKNFIFNNFSLYQIYLINQLRGNCVVPMWRIMWKEE